VLTKRAQTYLEQQTASHEIGMNKAAGQLSAHG